MIGHCMSSCPLDGQRIFNCLKVEECMYNCSMVVQIIALHCVNYRNKSLFREMSPKFSYFSDKKIISKFTPFVGHFLSDQVMLLDSFKRFWPLLKAGADLCCQEWLPGGSLPYTVTAKENILHKKNIYVKYWTLFQCIKLYQKQSVAWFFYFNVMHFCYALNPLDFLEAKLNVKRSIGNNKNTSITQF